MSATAPSLFHAPEVQKHIPFTKRQFAKSSASLTTAQTIVRLPLRHADTMGNTRRPDLTLKLAMTILDLVLW